MKILIAFLATVSIFLPFLAVFSMYQMEEDLEEAALVGLAFAIVLALFWIAGFAMVQIWQWAI